MHIPRAIMAVLQHKPFCKRAWHSAKAKKGCAAVRRVGDASEAGRSAKAPLAKVSSAHEDHALEHKLDASGFTPFGAPFAHTPQPTAASYAPTPCSAATL